MSVTLLLEAGYVALRRFRIAVDLVLAVCMLVQEVAYMLFHLGSCLEFVALELLLINLWHIFALGRFLEF